MTKTRRRLRGAALAATLAAGCYSPQFDQSCFACKTTADCPTGSECVAGLCVGAGICSAGAASDLGTPPNMLLVPGGTFTMGSAGAGYPDEEPAHPVEVGGFHLDRDLVTVADWRRCRACPPPATGGGCVFTASEGPSERLPVNCVTRAAAAAYCAARGARLPAEAELEYAARGPGAAAYAWGDAAPLAPGAPGTQLCWSSATPCPVGTYPATLLGRQTADGARDLAGNLWEWTSTPYCPYADPGCASALAAIRLGAFDRTSPGDVRAARRNATVPEAAAADIGFRCASRPGGGG